MKKLNCIGDMCISNDGILSLKMDLSKFNDYCRSSEKIDNAIIASLSCYAALNGNSLDFYRDFSRSGVRNYSIVVK